ncbi:hypothetical protein NNJEOMEG_02727 [Fundidesulfovibrio magnetotacticus]|uniref:Uncharacterized protein n=1 Tax=Fundidesulfovibrio magnetotacticus TaxID=2730080 RepID=A0A6V8LXV0_9BACT|nr:hypothetical protein [Fundidesulfovibrio magnetotacticus]GFK94879.1 hypothetical protein NNJEOMEG_02727 [Fundidesulfovibrio magnetotacticus]
MARSSVKHRTVNSTPVTFDGGLDLSQGPEALAPNQLSEARNMYYEETRNVLATRPGLVCAAEPPPGGPDITALHWYEKDTLTGCLVAATADGKLHSLDESVSPPAWNHVADLDQQGITPGLCTFHGRLVIADGGPCLRAWDGETVEDLEGSPSASAVAEIGGRLAANSAQDLDGVALCGPYDETDWDIADGGAIFLRAGYGDGLRVTGFGVIGQDLLVFKAGDSGKRIMRLQTAGPTSGWGLTQLSRNLTAHSGHCVEHVGNNLLFAGPGGIFDLAGVQQYGDLQVGGAGRPVNPSLNGKRVASMRFLPRLAVLLAFVEGDSQVLVYHPHNAAWTRLDFQGLFLGACCQAGERIFLAGRGGRLYRLGLGESRDEVQPGDFAPIKALVRSKMFTAPGGMILRSVRLDFEALTPGQGALQVLGADQVSPVTLYTWQADPGLGRLADADAPLEQASQPLGASSETQDVARARVRDRALSFQIATTAGRVRLRQCLAEMALAAG